MAWARIGFFAAEYAEEICTVANVLVQAAFVSSLTRKDDPDPAPPIASDPASKDETSTLSH